MALAMLRSGNTDHSTKLGKIIVTILYSLSHHFKQQLSPEKDGGESKIPTN
jgi:hypothetical protein